jgi:hypothetical protein
MDQLCKLYAGTVYAPIKRQIRPTTKVQSYGYHKGCSVDDLFGTLFEVLVYAHKWSDCPLVLGAQDVLTAFDSVRHHDILETYNDLGATPHQILALAREMTDNQVQITVRGVATSEPLTMSRALRTGNKPDPSIFVRMFEECLQVLTIEWDQLGLGFHLKTHDERLTHLLWVDNCFILADSLNAYTFMVRSLTSLLQQRFSWSWKPSSLEMIMMRVLYPHDVFDVEVDGTMLRYQVKSSIVALGGLLDTQDPNTALVRYRLDQGDKCFYKYSKYLCSKNPVGMKLSAFAGAPRSSASFLMTMCHWSKHLLLDVYRWERRHLIKVFRWR